MGIKFQPASRRQVRVRMALYGPSGSGKTYSALAIATGLAGEDGRVAVIDTEAGSSNRYAGLFTFDVLDMTSRNPEDYVHAIDAAVAAGYSVVIIDSLTHAWQELLDKVDRLQRTNRFNNFTAWSEATPDHKRLMDRILTARCHVLATMRSKTLWTLEDDAKGRKKPVRVGQGMEQRAGVEYEFDVVASLSAEHVLEVEKDRLFHQLQDAIIERPSEALGAKLREWAQEGDAPPQDRTADDPPQRDTVAPRAQPAASSRAVQRQTPKARVIQAVAEWSGVDRSDVPEAVRDTVAWALRVELEPGVTLEDEDWLDTLAAIQKYRAAGEQWGFWMRLPEIKATNDHEPVADDDIPF